MDSEGRKNAVERSSGVPFLGLPLIQLMDNFSTSLQLSLFREPIVENRIFQLVPVRPSCGAETTLVSLVNEHQDLWMGGTFGIQYC